MYIGKVLHTIGKVLHTIGKVLHTMGTALQIKGKVLQPIPKIHTRSRVGTYTNKDVQRE